MQKYLNKILIVDGSYFLHRAMKTPSMQELETTTGIKSGGIFGFFRMIQSEIKKYGNYFPIVCFDAGLAKRRTDLFPEYKTNRARLSADALMATGQLSEADEYLIEFRKQRDDTIRLLKALGIPSLLLPGWEGDDLMYLLSKVCAEGIVLSDDKDMIQLVSPTITIRRPMRDETITWADSDISYRHPHFTVKKAIIGDPSDNIPKCGKGLGDKTAEKIAALVDNTEFDTYKTVLENYVTENNKEALSKKVSVLLENWEQFIINYNLTDLSQVQPPVGFESMIKNIIFGISGAINLIEAYKILGKYEMNTIYPDQMIAKVKQTIDNVIM